MTTKRCPACAQTLPTTDFHRDKGTLDGLRCWCKSCVRKRFLEFKDSDNYKRRLGKYAEKRKILRKTSPQEVWVFDAFHNAKKRAGTLGVEFSITKEQLQQLLTERCPLLGVPFSFGHRKTVPTTPTIDRKDPKLGYVLGNVWVVSAKANRIKSDASTDEIERVALALRAAGV